MSTKITHQKYKKETLLFQQAEEATTRSQRKQTSRENEASHQEENLESEEFLATAEHP